MAAPALARILRASQIRYRGFRARGVPAILIGVSGIVLTVRALAVAAPSLAEALREATKLVDAMRTDRPRLRA